MNPVHPTARSWGTSFAPKSPRAAEELIVVPLRGKSGAECIALCCLQGLVARKQPTLWLDRHIEYGTFLLDQFVAAGDIKSYQRQADTVKLFEDFAWAYKGAVIADEVMFRGTCLALNVAACEDLILATPNLVKSLGLEVKVDLRGRFKTYHEGLRWVCSTYADKLNPHLLDYRDPLLIPHATFDLSIQHRGLIIWLTHKAEAALPGVDAAAELKLMNEILERQGRSAVSLGFPHGIKPKTGIGEVGGVQLLSRHGAALVCTNHRSNFSALSAPVVKTLELPKPALPPKLQKDKIYIALNLSDGDNQILWPKFFRGYFEHPAFGTFPLAFGVGPSIIELQPRLAQWYAERLKSNTELICDVSGAGYTNPAHFGEARDADAAWSSFLGWTKHLMDRCGLRSLRTVGGDDDVLQRYIRALPDCHSIFADMGRYSGRSGIENLTYRLDGMPVFRSVTSWRYGKDGFLRELREQVGENRPAFVNGFVHCWTFDMDALVRIQQQAGNDIVFVTPSQLAALYEQHIGG
jgi:hypothetical protein